MKKEKVGGLGLFSIFGLLGIAFIVLKLTEVVAWSWFWTTSPLWFGLSIILIILIGFAIRFFNRF